jgi:hypothetical protein
MYEIYDMKSTDMLFDMMFISNPIESITISSPRNKRRIPHVFPITYSKFDIDLVYKTSFVSSFLSLFRKSAARKITTIDCPMLSRYRLKSGTEEGIEISSQLSLPRGEKNPMFKIVKINRAPRENSLKNQLLLKVFASYFATVLILCRNAIYCY